MSKMVENININLEKDNYISRGDIIINKKALKFKEAIYFKDIDYETYREDIIDYILNNFNDIEGYKYSDIISLYSNKDYMFILYKDNILEVYSNTNLSDIYNDLSKFKYKEEMSCRFTDVYIENGKITEKSKNKTIEDFGYFNKLYYPYLDIEKMIDTFMKAKSNILVLSGDVGLGKTKIMDYFVKKSIINSNKQVKVKYVKDEEVLSNSSFWSDNTYEEPDIILLDDLDYALNPRKENATSNDDIIHNKFINYLLSYTDGIFKNNTKIIITTNKTIKNIDKGILRKGRMFDILELRDLSKEEALSVFLGEGFDKETFNTILTNNTILNKNNRITPSSLAEIIEDLKTYKSLENIENNNYLLEDNISLYKSFYNKKKLGL